MHSKRQKKRVPHARDFSFTAPNTNEETTMKKQIPYSQKSTDAGRSILALIIFTAGVVLSATALGDDPSLPAQNDISTASPALGAPVGTQETDSASAGEADVLNPSEMTTQSAGLSPVAFPIATTNPATLITSSSAKLNGSVNPNGLPTTVFFQYGRTTNYGTRTPFQTRTGTSARPVSANINGLAPRTTYHFRLVARNATGTRYGNDRTFTTTGASTCNIAGRWAGTAHGTWYYNNCSYTGTAFISATITQNGNSFSGVIDYDGIPCFNTRTCGILDFADTTGYVAGNTLNCPRVNATWHVTAISGACSGQSLSAPVTLTLNGNTLSGTTFDGFTVILTRQP